MTDLAIMPGARVVALARDWIGTPYHHQAARRRVGADCLGLIRGLWRELYGGEAESAPAYSPDWGEYGRVELLMEAARRNLVPVAEAAHGLTLPLGRVWEPGAVLLFRAKLHAVAKHCGVVSGPERMIHAYSGVGVRETAIGVWGGRVAAIFAFPARPGA